MPDDDLAWEQQQDCQKLLSSEGYQQYEISAYSRDARQCRHNLNYWHFGDYIGIGAGAHGKITLVGENKVLRRTRQRQPAAYLTSAGRNSISQESELSDSDLAFEFMLNALRLHSGFEVDLFIDTTGLSFSQVLPAIQKASQSGLISFDDGRVCPTERGLQYLNDLQSMFLDLKISKNQPFFSSEAKFIHS